MGIDGIFLYQLKKELTCGLTNTRVDKIHQPSKDELVLLLRGFEGAKRLLISVKPSTPKIHFSSVNFENPSEPPMFCMLMRKHLLGAKFLYIEDNGFERVVSLVFEGKNELGDKVLLKLVVELIGKQTNLILIGAEGRIIDSLRRSEIESAGRMIQPGVTYILPEKQLKCNILTESLNMVAEKIYASSMPLSKALVEVVDGISPLIAREIAVKSGIDTDKISSLLTGVEKKSLIYTLDEFKARLDTVTPMVLCDEKGLPFEFSYMDITQYGPSTLKSYEDSLSLLLEKVYSERDQRERIKSASAELSRLINNLTARISKKIAVRIKEQEKTANGEKWRIYGELLKANLYAVERGMPYVDVQNYYDSELKTVRIPLNVALTPAANAQRYFKEYKKCCNAQALLGKLIDQSREELKYIESVADELSRCETIADLNEIKLELASEGYLRKQNDRKKQQRASLPLEFQSPDGFKVFVGKNNRQNDELTLHKAADGDMWFHTKNIPGSHVIVCCNGQELPESTVVFAATLAAKHSKASGSSSVPVDYTRVKYVKKPSKAKPGMVIYKTNKTIFVTPKED